MSILAMGMWKVMSVWNSLKSDSIAFRSVGRVSFFVAAIWTFGWDPEASSE